MTYDEYLVQEALGTLPEDCLMCDTCGAFLHDTECNEDEDAIYCPICLGVITIKDGYSETL
jgi:hypothetical protein